MTVWQVDCRYSYNWPHYQHIKGTCQGIFPSQWKSNWLTYKTCNSTYVVVSHIAIWCVVHGMFGKCWQLEKRRWWNGTTRDIYGNGCRWLDKQVIGINSEERSPDNLSVNNPFWLTETGRVGRAAPPVAGSLLSLPCTGPAYEMPGSSVWLSSGQPAEQSMCLVTPPPGLPAVWAVCNVWSRLSYKLSTGWL